LASGVENVVVTLGEEGALLVNPDGVWRVKPPVVSHFNPTGERRDTFRGTCRTMGSVR
jgi:fructose-1-phosphate kinase PfkB-like protein